MISRQELSLLAQITYEKIENLYEQGYRTFLSGGALGFDTLAAQQVLKFRDQHQDLKLKMILPCRSQSNRWTPSQKKAYADLLSQSDEVLFLSDQYYDGCMLMRNRYMVVHSSACICYLKDRKGGTWYTVTYAWKNGLDIQNLAFQMR